MALRDFSEQPHVAVDVAKGCQAPKLGADGGPLAISFANTPSVKDCMTAREANLEDVAIKRDNLNVEVVQMKDTPQNISVSWQDCMMAGENNLDDMATKRGTVSVEFVKITGAPQNNSVSLQDISPASITDCASSCSSIPEDMMPQGAKSPWADMAVPTAPPSDDSDDSDSDYEACDDSENFNLAYFSKEFDAEADFIYEEVYKRNHYNKGRALLHIMEILTLIHVYQEDVDSIMNQHIHFYGWHARELLAVVNAGNKYHAMVSDVAEHFVFDME